MIANNENDVRNNTENACNAINTDNENVEVETAPVHDNNKSRKSWASLFNNKRETALNGQKTLMNDNILTNNTNGNVEAESILYSERNLKFDDPNYYRMGGKSIQCNKIKLLK